MRWLVALLLLTPGLAGCLGGLGEDDDVEPTTLTAPDLPEGIHLEGGQEVERSATRAVVSWAGTTTPLSGSMGLIVTSLRLTEPASTTLELPATVPLNLTFELGGADEADILLEVYDEYGRRQCIATDESCTIPWVRPTGAVRAWSLDVAGYLSLDQEIPFEVTVTVESLPYEGPLDPRVLAGLASIEPFEKTSFDGTVLRGHVYLPEGDGPFPTVLELSPYWNSASRHSEGAVHETPDGREIVYDRLGKLLENGYAVALVNLRGTGESDGCQSFFGPIDGKDAYHVIQGLAGEPWSNGNVGMTGISWYGYSQYAALRDQPPALKAVVPSSAILDQWTLWARYGPGIISQFGPLLPTYAVFLSLTTVGVRGDVGPSHALCPEYVEQARAYTELMLTGDESAWLAERAMHEVIANSTVPMFVTNGLTNGEGHILQVEGLWDLVPEGSRMTLGQWGHAFPTEDRVERFDQQVLDFFAEHLKGEEQRLAPDVVAYEDTAGTWRESPAWPPAATKATLHLSDGTLVEAADEVTPSSQTFVTPAIPFVATPEPGEDCPVNALYVSPPLAEGVLLAGNFLANLTVSSSLPNGNFAVYLYHGPEPISCDDALDGDGSTFEVRRAVSDLAHRGYERQGAPFPTTGSDVLTMRSYPFAEPVPAGHRLMLVVAGSSPEIEPKPLAPVLTVVTGPGIVGELTIPVVEGTLRFEDAGAYGAARAAARVVG